MRYIVLLLTCFSLHLKSQDIFSSNTGVESCLDQQNCITVAGTSYLFYDETRNEFYLKLDFSKFRSQYDSLNTWINDMVDSTLYFKAILPKENFPPVNTSAIKTFNLPGEVFYNDIIKQQNVEISVYSTENSLVVNGSGNFKYDIYKINFSLPVVTKDFKAYKKKLYYTNQTISINITMGRINLLSPGREFHLKEVYYQGTR